MFFPGTFSNGELRYGLILLRLSEFHNFTLKHNITMSELFSENPDLHVPELYREMFGDAIFGKR